MSTPKKPEHDPNKPKFEVKEDQGTDGWTTTAIYPPRELKSPTATIVSVGGKVAKVTSLYREVHTPA